MHTFTNKTKNLTVHLEREHVQSRTYETIKLLKVVTDEYRTVGGGMMENEILS
jgi:hypothetical protein